MTKQPLIRAVSTEIVQDGRTLEGLALRWNHASKVTDDGASYYLESFTARATEKTLRERAAIPLPLGMFHPWQPGSPAADSVLFDEPVGSVRFTATSEGLAFRARVAKTDVGDEVLAMVRTGELADVSIGFVPYKSEKLNDVIVRTEIALLELSLAPTGTAQHDYAKVLAVRAGDHSTQPDNFPRREWVDRRSSLDLWLP